MTSIPARATGAPQDSNFTRNATGLVREVSMWDALIMNTLGMNVAVGSVLLLQQAPAIFPGGNLVLAVVIGTVIMAFTLLWVYSEFAAAMPRRLECSARSVVHTRRSLESSITKV